MSRIHSLYLTQAYNTIDFNFSDFKLIAKAKECKGSETAQDYLESVDACAHACRGSSEMFVYGTEEFDFSNSRCEGSTCRCICQHDTVNHKCKVLIDHKGYNLYAFKKDGEII